MDAEFVDLTADNLADEHLCCIIRTKKAHPGVEAKRRWLSDRLREGHVFRKLNAKGVVFIEYAPLETAWVPVIGDNYYYIYCLWVAGPYKGKGYAKALMEHCLADARTHGKSGVCMLGAEKQKAWLSDQSFARKFGFEVVDTTDNGYELLALSFDGTTPKFAENVRKGDTGGGSGGTRMPLPAAGRKRTEQIGAEICGRSRKKSLSFGVGRLAGRGASGGSGRETEREHAAGRQGKHTENDMKSLCHSRR